MNVVFLHVGTDPSVVLLVRSIRQRMPGVTIVHCTDLRTPQVPGTNRVLRHDGDVGNMMTFRLEAFAALGLSEPAAYLDSDMLLVRPFVVADVLGDRDAVLCRRSFKRETVFNIAYREIDLSEYAGRSLDEVYPYLACFTVTRDHRFWADCRDVLAALDPKFHFWFGDQEALKAMAARPDLRWGTVDEADFACLPDLMEPDATPHLLHFKGTKRKTLMVRYANMLEPPR